MKKAIIAAGASAVLAAMPVVGVFAETISPEITDNIQLTLSRTCAITATGTTYDGDTEQTSQSGNTFTYKGTLTLGQATGDLGATSINIKCNATGGWVLNAVGAATGGLGANYLVSSNTDHTNEDIASSATPTFSGNTSDWGMKVTSSTNPSLIQGTFGTDYTQVPASSTAVAKSLVATDASTSGSGVTVTPTYKVFASSTQAAATYSGAVKYTLLTPATATN